MTFNARTLAPAACAILLTALAAHQTADAQDVTVTYEKTLVAGANPFDPAAVWEGPGQTADGQDVMVRTFGLVTEPDPNSNDILITDFNFQILGGGLDTTLNLTGVYTPTTPLIGDAVLSGTQNSMLTASTTDGLVNVFGQVSFTAIPEPSSVVLCILAVASCVAFGLRRRRE